MNHNQLIPYQPRHPLPWLMLLVLAILAVVVYSWHRQSLGAKCRDLVSGIDVSRWQATIDWAQVRKNGVSFAFIKATEGTTITDPTYLTNWEAARQQGVLRGAYHFYRPAKSGVWQARLFIKTVTMKRGDLPPVLDMEETDGRSKAEIVEGAKDWLRLVEAHYGIRPILYVNRSFYKKYLADDFADYTIWVAAYQRPVPHLADGREWQFWQYSDDGRIKGIGEPVDLNVFCGSYQQLVNMAL